MDANVDVYYNPRQRRDVVLFSAECVCFKPLLFFSDLSRLSHSYHERIHIIMIHLVEECVSVCLHDNLKTIADICFLLGIRTVCWRKISDEFTVKVTGQGHFRRVQGHSVRL